MKTYTQKKKIQKYKDSLEYDENFLDEGAVRDFLKVAGKRFFTSSKYINTIDANKAKILFTNAFIDSLSQIKFKKLSVTRLLFDPNDIIKLVQKKLHEQIEREIINPANGKILDLEIYSSYESNTSLADEIYKIVKRIEDYIKRDFGKLMSEVYKVNPHQQKTESYQRFFNKFKDLFLKIFEPTESKIQISLNLDTFSKKSKFEKIAFEVIKEIKKQSATTDFPVDIENTFIIDNEDDLRAIAGESEEEVWDNTRIKKEIEEKPHRFFLTLIQEFGKKYKITILISEQDRYVLVAKAAYEDLLIEREGKTRINRNDIIERMYQLVGPQVENKPRV